MKALEMARNNAVCLAIVAVFCLGSLFTLANPLSLGAYEPPSRHGGVTHIVMFQFKETVAIEAIVEVTCTRLAILFCMSCANKVQDEP